MIRKLLSTGLRTGLSTIFRIPYRVPHKQIQKYLCHKKSGEGHGNLFGLTARMKASAVTVSTNIDSQKTYQISLLQVAVSVLSQSRTHLLEFAAKYGTYFIIYIFLCFIKPTLGVTYPLLQVVEERAKGAATILNRQRTTSPCSLFHPSEHWVVQLI